jgi:hypothetical protein
MLARLPLSLRPLSRLSLPRSLSVVVSTSSPSAPAFGVTDSCARRVEKLCEMKGEEVHLRVAVDAGGCSGFQYEFEVRKAKGGGDAVGGGGGFRRVERRGRGNAGLADPAVSDSVFSTASRSPPFPQLTPPPAPPPPPPLPRSPRSSRAPCRSPPT